jgi:tetratricopeptide (TPR) repeat protein
MREGRLAGAAPPAPAAPPEEPVPLATLWLLLAYLAPNAASVMGSFLYDDLPLIVQNARLHSLSRLGEIWTHGYWPDRPGLTLYRPVTETLWSLLWAAGGGRPLLFHAVTLALGAAAVLLVHRLLLDLSRSARTAFAAALLFAVLPIHSEDVAAVAGSNELLAAVFGIGALILYRRGRSAAALALFILGVFSKESAATFGVLALVLPFLEAGPRPRLRLLALHGALACAVVLVALWARRVVAEGPVFVPPIDNPMSLTDPARRILSALWIQVLYLGKCVFPVTLSADYSYKAIPLVMNLGNPRAWGGLALVAGAAWAFLARPATRIGICIWVVSFLPAANVLMAIGTAMGERLAYVPSIGLVLLLAQGIRRVPGGAVLLAAAVLAFAARTYVRDGDWHDADRFYVKLAESSPGNAKAQYCLGCLRSARGDDLAAVECFNRAIAIFAPYPEALNNRGCSLVRLGRIEEAKESFRQCLRFDPGHTGAAASLAALEAGNLFVPQVPRI